MDVTLPSGSVSNFIVESTTRNICGKGMSYLADRQFPDYDTIVINLFFNEKTSQYSSKISLF